MNIPGYNIEQELGSGGMATVYLAEQQSLERQVALKIMSSALAADADFGKRFLREGRTVAKLSHPHIIGVYDIGLANHNYFLIMEYVSGGDLKQRLANGALPPQQALEILRQVASALGYAHQQGFVHRDVKPENILFRADGAAVLTDFGIAKAVGAGTRMTATGMTIGTSHYMSPEQARGQEVDGRSDLYSLGVVFYEMLTANVPYQAADSFAVALKHINDPVPQLPSELAVYQPLLDRMLAKEPIDRYQDLPSMLAELKNEASESNGAGIKVIRSGTELMPEIAKPPQKRSPWEPAPKPKKPKREPSPSDSYWVGYLTLTILLAGIIALLILPNI